MATPKIEFLISTMHRSKLDFLDGMFKHFNWKVLNILIINQTTKDNTLTSNYKNVRVINAFEKGLSRSRNLAIKNSDADIALIADDDVEYLPTIFDTVIKAYNDYYDAALISFQYVRENNKTFKIYKSKEGYQHHLLHKQSLTSMEISIRPKILNQMGVTFNTIFSFGERFHWFEEQVFRDDIIRAKLKIAYIPTPIVKHYGKTSVPDENTKEYTQAIVAQKYLSYKKLIYLWLIRYIWKLLRRKVIKLSEISKFWNYGITAVQDYKTLASEQSE